MSHSPIPEVESWHYKAIINQYLKYKEIFDEGFTEVRGEQDDWLDDDEVITWEEFTRELKSLGATKNT